MGVTFDEPLMTAHTRHGIAEAAALKAPGVGEMTHTAGYHTQNTMPAMSKTATQAAQGRSVDEADSDEEPSNCRILANCIARVLVGQLSTFTSSKQSRSCLIGFLFRHIGHSRADTSLEEAGPEGCQK